MNIKINKRIIITLSAISLIIIVCIIINLKNIVYIKETILNESLSEFEINTEVNKISRNILKKGCIKDEDMAIEIADIMFSSVYGENYDEGRELVAKYNENLQYWFIKTNLPLGIDGGEKYIIINNKNLEIIAIWATK